MPKVHCANPKAIREYPHLSRRASIDLRCGAPLIWPRLPPATACSLRSPVWDVR